MISWANANQFYHLNMNWNQPNISSKKYIINFIVFILVKLNIFLSYEHGQIFKILGQFGTQKLQLINERSKFELILHNKKEKPFKKSIIYITLYYYITIQNFLERLIFLSFN